MRFTLRQRVREVELRLDYSTTEQLAEAIKDAVQAVARAEAELDDPLLGGEIIVPLSVRQDRRGAAEQKLIELVRYAGRSGLLNQ